MTSPESPAIPARLSRLPELASDLWWTWNRAREVFRRLDYPLWRQSNHNPVLMLDRLTPSVLEHAAADPAFLARYDETIEALDAMRASTRTWWRERVAADPSACSPATTARKRATWACRSSASDSCIRRGTSASG
jgi:glucan phosphorylase